jgi:hypothetical protein
MIVNRSRQVDAQIGNEEPRLKYNCFDEVELFGGNGFYNCQRAATAIHFLIDDLEGGESHLSRYGLGQYGYQTENALS